MRLIQKGFSRFIPAMVFLLSCSVLALVPVRAEAQSAKSGSRIVLDAELHDFGTVKQGDVLEHSFKVSNTGGIPLEISDVKTS